MTSRPRSANRLELDGLTRRYGDRVALDGVSFTVEPGQTFRVRGAQRRRQDDCDAPSSWSSRRCSGSAGPSKYTIAGGDAHGRAVAARAAQLDDGFGAEVTAKPHADVTITGSTIHAAKDPHDKLVNLLQVANQQLDVRAAPPLRLTTVEPIDPEKDAKAGLAFSAIFILHGRLPSCGYWGAAGVVQEKSSRVIEVLLARSARATCSPARSSGSGCSGSRSCCSSRCSGWRRPASPAPRPSTAPLPGRRSSSRRRSASPAPHWTSASGPQDRPAGGVAACTDPRGDVRAEPPSAASSARC